MATAEQPTPKPNAQLTSLFSNDVLARAERMRLNPMRRLTNRSRGEHLSGKGGSSTDFADFRNYVAGDDVRYVDWNIFARLQRPYMKLFQHEEEMHVVIIVDASTSMMFDGKLDRAKQLAGAFAAMGLLNIERVSVYVCNHIDERPVMVPPCTGRVSVQRIFKFLEGIEGGGNFPIDEGIETVLRFHRGRGVAIVLSDFLTFGDMERSLNLLFSNGLEIFAGQILGQTELDPEFTGDMRLVDSETGHTLDITSAADLMSIYHDHRAALANGMSLFCRQRSGRFASINAGDPIETVLFSDLIRNGWVLR